MTEGLQCPACDVVIPFENDQGERSLSQLLGAGVSQSVSDATEARLREHLGSPTLEDFVAALVMADRYIAQVEIERDEAVQWRRDFEARLAAAQRAQPIVSVPVPGVPDLNRPQHPRGDPREAVASFDDVFIQPERRMRVDPDRTLIPHVPTGQRPEGVVGRKTI